MKKILFGLVAVFALAVSAVQAGTVSLAGDVDGSAGAKLGGGSFNVLIDLDSADTLSGGGGIDFAIQTSAPGIIEFTSAQIGTGAWDVKSAVVAGGGQRVQLNTTALFQAGLPAGGQDQVLATINYSVVNPAGSAGLDFSLPGEAAIVDGGNTVNPDRTSAYTFVGGRVTFIPEPASLAMAGMSLIGLVLRRRNG